MILDNDNDNAYIDSHVCRMMRPHLKALLRPLIPLTVTALFILVISKEHC